MITLERARDLLKRAVDTQGRDFVYNLGGVNSCRYEPIEGAGSDDPRSKTGCLVGVALGLAGETRHRGSANSVYGLKTHGLADLSDAAADYLDRAQASQDGGSTWGDAYDLAEGYATKVLNDLEDLIGQRVSV